jgi:tetratricopeptide (TPR) repeat protein
LGRAREAEPLLEESIVLLRRAGEQFNLVASLFYRAVADIASARLDRLDETVGEMESAARVAGGRLALGYAHQVRGRAAAARGDLEAARRHLGEARRLHVDNGDVDIAGEMDVMLAVTEHAAGNRDAARRLLDDALGRLAAGGSATPPAFFAEALRARMDAEAGRLAEARRRLEALGEESARSPSVRRRLAFLASRAALAGSEQRFEDARRDLESALRAARDAGRTLDHLTLGLDLAELDLRAGDRAQGTAAARRIAAEADSLGLAAVVARAKALAALPARARNR